MRLCVHSAPLHGQLSKLRQFFLILYCCLMRQKVWPGLSSVKSVCLPSPILSTSKLNLSLRVIKFSKNSLFQQFQFWGDRIRYNLSMKKVSEENERRRLMLRKNLENSRQIKFIGTNTSLYLKGHQIRG